MLPHTSITKIQNPAYLRVFYLLALATLIVYILIVGATLLKLIAVASFLAMLLTPLAEWLERKRFGHFAGAILPVLALFFGFIFLATLTIRQIGSMIRGVVGMIIIIPVLSISMHLFRLSPRTEPFAYLLGIPPTSSSPRQGKTP